MMKWQHHVKNALFIALTTALLLTAPASTLVRHGEYGKGFLIFAIAIALGTVSILISRYWHRRDIHVTFLGFTTAGILFILVMVWFLLEKYDFWLPIALIAIPVAIGYLIGKNRTP